MSERKIHIQSGTGGFIWFTSWLFCVGYLKLSFTKGVWALLLWPYFLGVHVSGLMPQEPAAITQTAEPATLSDTGAQ